MADFNGCSVSRITTLPPDLPDLIEPSLAEGFRLVERLQTEWESGLNQFSLPGEALFEARDRGGRLLGICGLNCDPYYVGDANAVVGRVRHLYVLPGARRHGVGKCLVNEVIRTARGPFEVLRLRTTTREGIDFYEAIGFSAVSGHSESPVTHTMNL